MDLISVSEERFVFVGEAKKSSVGKAMGQCLCTLYWQ